MGYDMKIVDDPTDQAEVARCRGRFFEAVERRDASTTLVGRTKAQTLVEERGREMAAAEIGSFHLSMSAMFICRTRMAERGMGHDEGGPRPPWPRPEAYGYLSVDEYRTEDEIHDEDETDSSTWPERLRRFREDAMRVLAWSPEIPGIPLHKLSSNDGWLVHPIDCLGALHRLDEFRQVHGDTAALLPSFDGRPVGWWGDWIAYLHLASQHGGFRVT